MRFRAIADSLGLVLMFFSITFIVPFIAILYYWTVDYDPATQLKTCQEGFITIAAFLIPAFMCLLLGLALRLLGKGYSENVRNREAFAIVSISWLLIAFIGCLPYFLSGTIPNFFSAYFESMSGFTTTGATVLEIPANAPVGADYLDVYPHSVMLWRSLTQWLGGMGIIVLSVVILSQFLGGGMSLLKAEMPGPAPMRLKPKIAQTARFLWVIYVTFTILQITALRLAGMDGFDAVNHTFTTLATGGFGTHVESIAYYNNVWIDAIIIFFMIVAGVNFILHYNLIAGRGDKRLILKDPEFRSYMLFLALGTCIIATILLTSTNITTFHSIRVSAFQAVSIMTTTGYATVDFATWPDSAQFILLILMMIGGCAGSTGGGIKVVRMLIVFKWLRREIRKEVHPSTVMPITLGSLTIPEKTVQIAGIYFIVYLVIFAVSILLISLMGYDLISSISAVAATLGNVGPALGIFGPVSTYKDIPFYGKMLLVICMWLGRLEIFAGIFLFFPSSYRH